MDTRIPSFLLSGLLSISAVPSAFAEISVDVGLTGSSSVTVGNTVNTTTSADTTVTVESSTTERPGRIARCKHFRGEKKERCLHIVDLQIQARGNAEAHADVRAAHGKFMRDLREEDDHDVRHEKHNGIWGDIREQLQDFFAQIRARVSTKVEAARETCKSKKDAERDQCLLDANVSLQAIVKAMLDAALSVQ